MGETIRATIAGPDAEPGRIAAADVARLIVGLERAIARAAYLVLGRQRRGTGRHQAAIEQASRLRFVGVESGSFVQLLALPEGGTPTDDELPMPVETLSGLAFDRLASTLRHTDSQIDQELAAAVAQLADDLGIGDRTERLTLQRGKHTPVGIDVTVRSRMRLLAVGQPDERSNELVGTLVEADFERYSARLQPPAGPSVTVRFSPSLSDEIHEALRHVATLEGVVSYDPRTSVATSIQLRELHRSEQLEIEVGEFGSFWASLSFEELRQAQGVGGPIDLDALYDSDLNDEDREKLFAALAGE